MNTVQENPHTVIPSHGSSTNVLEVIGKDMWLESKRKPCHLLNSEPRVTECISDFLSSNHSYTSFTTVTRSITIINYSSNGSLGVTGLFSIRN